MNKPYISGFPSHRVIPVHECVAAAALRVSTMSCRFSSCRREPLFVWSLRHMGGHEKTVTPHMVLAAQLLRQGTPRLAQSVDRPGVSVSS